MLCVPVTQESIKGGGQGHPSHGLPAPAGTLKLQETPGWQSAAEGKGGEIQPASSEYVLGLLPSSPEPQTGAQHTLENAGKDVRDGTISLVTQHSPAQAAGDQLCKQGCGRGQWILPFTPSSAIFFWLGLA